jgi:hypothetical protein
VLQIVLATNIAETAITIDDIVCVINSGRLKEKSFDPYTSVSTLQVGAWDGAVNLCWLCLRDRWSCQATLVGSRDKPAVIVP